MNDKAILDKAIKKARANGWESDQGFEVVQIGSYCFLIKGYVPSHILFDINEVIYDHDFAKALWGSELVADQRFATTADAEHYTTSPAWQKHLMHMVIADDPIKYLGENI